MKKSKTLEARAGGGSKDRSALETPMGSGELAKLAGVSVRQLQWWDEQCVIKPWSTSGHKRLYTPEQVRFVIALGKLRGTSITGGIPVQRCRKISR